MRRWMCQSASRCATITTLNTSITSSCVYASLGHSSAAWVPLMQQRYQSSSSRRNTKQKSNHTTTASTTIHYDNDTATATTASSPAGDDNHRDGNGVRVRANKRVPGVATFVSASEADHSRHRSTKFLTQVDLAGVEANPPSISHRVTSAPLTTEPIIERPLPPQRWVQKLDKRTFQDRVRVYARGGHGGAGCVSYERLPRSGKMGPPDGMAGANGGDVYLRACTHVASLIFTTQHFRGNNGENGKIKAVGKSAAGADRYIDVPLGTVVHHIISSAAEMKDKQSVRLRQVADLSTPGQSVCVATGGAGGLGNRAFRDPMRRDCNFSQLGKPGEEKDYVLELKVIADVGLVGYPNAGKSSLLSSISRATPEIAAYPFTTLRPYVGTVFPFGNEHHDTPSAAPPPRFTVADLPGLIEGAHDGRGLGREFLRHVERCKVLVYVIDVAATDGRDPVSDLKSLQNEVGLYNASLLDRPAMIVANKCDKLADDKDAISDIVARLRTAGGHRVYTASALQQQGLDKIIQRLWNKIEKQIPVLIPDTKHDTTTTASGISNPTAAAVIDRSNITIQQAADGGNL